MKRKTKSTILRCPYCGRNAVLRKADFVYHETSLTDYLYVCSAYPECDSYVGVHEGTQKPKGSLANGDLRHKRIITHQIFDTIWKHGIMTRKNAYFWIQDIFGLPPEKAHIGNFSEYMCDQLMIACQKVLSNHKLAC